MSFAQEVKDFLAGWTAVNEITNKNKNTEIDRKYREAWQKISESELGIKQEELKLKQEEAKRRAALGSDSGLTPYQERSLALKERELELKEDAANNKTAETNANAIADSLPDEEDDVGGYVPTANQAAGGLVQHAVEGAPVTALPTEEDTLRPPPPRPNTATSAVPVEPPKPETATTAPEPAVTTAPKQPDPEATKIILKPAEDALSAVTETFITELGKPTSGTEGKSNPRLPLEDFNTILKTIDPEGKLPPHMETAAALGAAFTVVKDPAKKYKLATGVLGSAMEQSQILGSLIPDALRAGDADAVCRLMNDACNKFPTGHRVEVTPIAQGFSFQVLDPEGKVMDKGQLTPEEMLTMSGKVADGSLFLQNLYQFQQNNKDTKGSPDRALQLVEQAASELAGIREAKALTDDETELAAITQAEKDAIARLNEMKGKAAGLKVKPSDVRAAQTAGLALAIPYEAPGAGDAPAQGGNDLPWYKRMMLSDEEEKKLTGQGQAVPTETPAPTQTPAVTPEGNTALKPLPADIAASAKAAIAKGADRAAVLKRLTENGFSVEGL